MNPPKDSGITHLRCLIYFTLLWPYNCDRKRVEDLGAGRKASGTAEEIEFLHLAACT